MRSDRLRGSGIQGVALIAITYVYFLIFAQFGFLHRLDELGITGAHLKSVMAAMALGGILLSLLAPRVRVLPSLVRRLQLGFAIAGFAAFLTTAPLHIASALVASLLIGAGLGLLTVNLVANLLRWIGHRHALLKVGIGTGTGYLLCNVPLFFTASTQVLATVAGLLCILGLLLAGLVIEGESHPEQPELLRPAVPFVLVVASFAALIWLDSAAFYIIQNSTVLKAGTWQGSAHLWANGLIHFSAALLGVWLLRRRGILLVLAAAVGALAFACLLLLDPTRALTAAVFYPIGVSLYSVALVAYPSLLSRAATSGERGRQAGWIYALGGWIGSALGIGMGQNLGHVPPAFVAIASAVVLAPLLIRIFQHRPRELAVTGVVSFVAFLVYWLQPLGPVAASPTAVERGRLVYISEGCIHCHSQYVRPNTADVLMWGPVENLDEIHRQRPPLIGNRRQGPDLSQVGARRSALWLKMQLNDPTAVSGSAVMPSYAFLFRDGRGNDLVAYLASLRSDGAEKQRAILEQQWHLSEGSFAAANVDNGGHLYDRYCATCHNSDGKMRLKWQSQFIESPAVISAGILETGIVGGTESSRINHLAQIIKFGIPNSDMAGHEYLSDRDIASLTAWLTQKPTQPNAKR